METEEYPLYPELTMEGSRQAQDLMTKFEKELKEKAVDVIEGITTEFYFDIVNEVESDQWDNYRSKIINGICDYSNKDHSKHDFEKIRKAIYRKHKADIVNDLNQDLLKEIERLKKLLEEPF